MTKSVSLIETDRLVLRGIEEGDTDIIVKWRSDPEVYRYFTSPHPLTAEEHERWFREIYCHDFNRWDWLALEKTAKTPVGLFGVKREKEKNVEVSYLLAPEAQHKGYAGEALENLLKWAKGHCRATIATANIHRDNTASLRFIERLKFGRDIEQGKFLIYRKTLEGL